MCGIIAAFSDRPDVETAVRRGMDRMRRRGPDGEGLWREQDVCLGHRRLAVIDLDARAAQPMVSTCGRYVIVLNGEIYNYAELREDLMKRGAAFRTTSDTEVILAAFAAEGAAMLSRLQGMFAFVIWDRETRKGFAARDPYGIKPMFYTASQRECWIASQVRALTATGVPSRDPDWHGRAGFWLLGSVPEPSTWYRDIKALLPGHYMWIEGGRAASPVCWFDIAQVWRDAPRAVPTESEVRAIVRDAVRASVDRHLVADVPVGVFLSGGIDSGALAAQMSLRRPGAIEGVTLTYDEFGGTADDEAPVAATIAAQYGIRHHVRRVDRHEFEKDLPRIIDAMDQPSIDGINTWYASKAVAERGLKVVVSGVGGDELFQGYSSFETLPRVQSWWQRVFQVPGATSAGMLAGRWQARRTGNRRWRHAARWARTIDGAWWLRRSLHAPDDLPSVMHDAPPGAVTDVDPTQWVRAMTGPLARDARLALGQIESTTYLRNQLLRDSDWASMDHSVELRTPLVDAQLLLSLRPVLAAFSRWSGKRMLADAPEVPLTAELAARPKTGFGIPVGRWMSAPGSQAGVTEDSRSWARRVADAYGQVEPG